MSKKSTVDLKQIKAFREAARALETDESESGFDEKLKAVARHKPSPETKRPPQKPAHGKNR